MQTTPADLNRRRRIGDAIDALRLITCDDLKALDDDMLRSFNTAIGGVAAFSSVELDIRHWTRRDAADVRETTDTAWPDAIEETAA